VTKAEALKNFQPLPDLRFSLARVEVRVLVHGDAAVLTSAMLTSKKMDRAVSPTT
jgi:hypothetical protein